jgi:general secretion pathway protein B
MSYILDALKKIEHEKHKKAGPDGRVSITGDLFHERTHSQGKAGRWKIATLVVVAVTVACAGTWFVLRGGQKTHMLRPEVSSKPVIATPAVIPPPVPVQAVQAPPVQSAPVTAAPRQPVDARQAGSTSAPSRSARYVKKETTQRSPSSVPKQAAPTVAPPADIKLSGIAWQDERAGRRAVINGFLLKEGAVVSGAKITDIQADRVRFAMPSGVFELRLDGALPLEVKK